MWVPRPDQLRTIDLKGLSCSRLTLHIPSPSGVRGLPETVAEESGLVFDMGRHEEDAQVAKVDCVCS